MDHCDSELLNAILATQTLEALHRHLAASSDKLDELSTFTVVELAHSLPEDLHWLRLRRIALVRRVLLQIVYIDGLEPRDQQLQLPVIKDLDQVSRHHRKESVFECLDLLGYLLLQAIVCDKFDILLFIIICHEFIGAPFA